MSSEYLTFNQGSQWQLHKAVGDTGYLGEEPKSNAVPGNRQYKVYRGKALTGELHQDFGQRGVLHDYGAGKKPKAEKINWKNVDKPHHDVNSVYNERNPGVGD